MLATFIRYPDLLSRYPNAEYQQFCNQYFEFLNLRLQEEDKFDLNQLKEVTYFNKYIIQLPTKYLEMQGHKLETMIIKALVADTNKLKRFPNESVAKQIIKTIEALPYFISKDTFILFQGILNSN